MGSVRTSTTMQRIKEGGTGGGDSMSDTGARVCDADNGRVMRRYWGSTAMVTDAVFLRLTTLPLRMYASLARAGFNGRCFDDLDP